MTVNWCCRDDEPSVGRADDDDDDDGGGGGVAELSRERRCSRGCAALGDVLKPPASSFKFRDELKTTTIYNVA